jgi:hypothetical protein
MRIPLTQGLFAEVSDEDFAELSQHRWCAARDHNTYYAVRTKTNNGVHTHIRMHREVIKAEKGQIVDHKDRNTLNNTRGNLRICDALGNSRNRKVRSDSRTGLKGVYLITRYGRFQARITLGSDEVSLGVFPTAIEAAEAYNKAAKKHFGEYAFLNDTTL